MSVRFITAVIVFGAGVIPAVEPMPRCDVVPDWTQFGPSRSYGADTLYDYMDGNSEGYLIYGFQQMRGVTCKSGDLSFIIDISTMPDPESAFGLYASNRDPRLPAEAIGMSGQIVPQRGIFVKGNRFIEISASPTSVDHSAAIRTFLKALDANLDGTTAMPGPVEWFPKEGLDAASIRLIPQSVLGLSVLKRGYIAKYDYGRAFVVRQQSPESAQQVMAKLRQRFGESVEAIAIGEEAFQANDKYLGRLVFFRKGVYIAGFANLSNSFDAKRAAESLATRMP